jgi:hypothetical protein
MKNHSQNSEIIFNNVSEESKSYFNREGFAHYRFNNQEYLDLVDLCYKYSSTYKGEKAFRNSAGIPRQYIYVVKKSYEIRKLVETKFLKEICKLFLDNKPAYLTHSKISFKTKGESSEWLPHQDNGYKLKSNSYIRKGFAIFICLEEMNSSNGQLIVWPRSHLNGTIAHSIDLQDNLSGDYQVFNDVVAENEKKPINANAGDIIIFTGDTFHSSGNTTNNSNRYSLVFEVEMFDSSLLKLDDYGNHPFFIIGKPKLIESFMLKLKSVVSLFWLWRILKKNRSIAGIIKKFFFKQKYENNKKFQND